MIEVRIDDRFRLTSAMLLLTVHGRLQGQFASHPLKLRTLEWLAPYSGHPALRLFRRMAQNVFMDGFYGFASYLGGPGDFNLPPDDSSPQWRRYLKRITDDTGYGPRAAAEQLRESMADFYAEAHLTELWYETAEAWEAARAQTEAALTGSGIEEWLTGFFGPTRLRFVAVPMPTDPASCGFGPSNEDEVYAITGPNPVERPSYGAHVWLGAGGLGAGERGTGGQGELLIGPGKTLAVDDPFDYSACPPNVTRLCFHEFMHRLVRGFVQATPGLVRTMEEAAARRMRLGPAAAMYQQYKIALDELIIRAVSAIREGETAGPEAAMKMVKREAAGFGTTPLEVIYEALLEYYQGKKTGQYGALAEFGPVLMERLSRWRPQL